MIGDGDVEAIFNSGDFDEPAAFSNGLTVQGWFTDGSDATTMYGVEIEASKPTLICSTDEIATVRSRMTVTIRSVVYTVEKIERNGTGASSVYLKT